MIAREALMLAGSGIVVGVAASMAVTRLISGLVFGVSVTDPVTFASVAILLAAVAFLAAFIPARRAIKVDPMVALRYE
jgi:putative ABC transport system permease protein